MRILTAMILALLTTSVFSQTTTIEGYIFESGNRGYLSEVSVTAEDINTEKILGKTKTDIEGFFQIEVPKNTKIRLYAAKDMFDIKRLETEVGHGKSFVKLEMGRAPGYTFEVTLAEKKDSPETAVDAITGTRIEVYNNTTRKSLMDLKDHESPTFQLNLEKGNHYTILLRKNGFLSKRMEAKVDVEGCILCFEGVGRVGPGVSDNLTENNAFGVLLANVELERIFEGKTMEIQNLYYDLGKYKLKGDATNELNKVITLMKDNPNLTLELGSHTDSRGNANNNLELSKKRAKSAFDYLLESGGIIKSRIVYKGYGEINLLNKCVDGVKCTEEEHAINRRTELKIVGITDMKEVKSLAQMKKEVQLEEEIMSLMDQEQIQAKDLEELREKIGEIGEIGEIEEIEEIGEIGEIEEIEEIGEIEKIGEIGKIEKIEEAVILKEINKAINMAKLGRDNEVESEIATEVKIEVDDKTLEEPTIGSGDEIEEGNEFKYKFPPITDGIKVILHQSSTLLENDHVIFLRHRNVELYESKRGKIYYIIGGFKTESDAFQFLQSYIASDKNYKNPFVAKFTDGNMAVVNQ
jgi:outer membrane protein OmpA-like peptidoglycan-associated protein